MADGTEGPGEADFDFLVGSTPDGRIVLDFRGMKIDHLKLTQLMALDLAESLCEAVGQAKEGIIVSLDRQF